MSLRYSTIIDVRGRKQHEAGEKLDNEELPIYRRNTNKAMKSERVTWAGHVACIVNRPDKKSIHFSWKI
jgi:hypothetical protein